MSEITLEMVRASQLTQTLHFDGPKGKNGFFGDWFSGIQYPRLQRKVTYTRADRGITVEWYVDGQLVGPHLEDAVPLLNQPPVLTEEESQALTLFDRTWRKWVDLKITYPVLKSLGHKGMIEAQRGLVRLRDGNKP